MADRIFHHVTWDRLTDWLCCGWMMSKPNALMHHHEYGVLVEWLCDCKMARPQ